MGILLITGASGGIGAATARLAAARGWDVAVHYHGNAAAAEAVAADVRAAGRRALTVQADLAEAATIPALFAAVDAGLGPLSGLVNNAGITGPMGRVEAIDPAMLDHLLRLNVAATVLCAKEAVRRMSTRHGGVGGAIVNVSSRAAALGSPNEFVHYAASKGAVDSLTIGLAKEVAAEGIRVNAVNPGLIDTDIHAKADRDIGPLIGGVPMQRVGTAEEVAETVVWLLSGAAGYVTGALLPVGGGR